MNNYTFSNQKRVANHGVLNFRLFSLFIEFVRGFRSAKPTGFSRKKTFAHITFILSFFLLVNESAMGQTTVTYAQRIAHYNAGTVFTVGTAGAFNQGTSQVGMFANGGATKQVVAWRTLKTAGDNTGSNRSLQVGDVFRISVSANTVFGEMGFALLSSPSSRSSWNDRLNNAAVSVRLSNYGNWYATYSDGTTANAATSTGSNNIGGTTSYKNFVFTCLLTAPNRMNITITDGTTTSNLNDVLLNNSGAITEYSIFSSDDFNGVQHRDIFWNTNSTAASDFVRNTLTMPIGGSNGSFTISGVLPNGLAANSTLTSSVNALTKSGSGSLTLSNNNTYTGTTTISAGTLLLGAAGSGSNTPLGTTTGATTVSSGGVLDLNGFNLATAEGLTINGTGISSGGALINTSGTSSTWAGTVTLGSASRVGGGGNLTLSGVVSGGFALTKAGAGTLTLSNTNTYTGGTVISEGTVSASATANLGSNLAAGAITLGNGSTIGTLNITSSLSRLRINVTDASSAGVINVATGQTFTLTNLNTASGTNTATKIGKSGPGTLTLSGAGTYVGQTQIGEGSVIVSNNAGLGTNNSTVARGIDLGLNVGDVSQANNVSVLATNGITLPQSIYVAPNTTSATRTIGLSGASGTATFNNEIYLDGNLTVTGTGTVVLSGRLTNTGGIISSATIVNLQHSANNYSGTTTINSGSELRLNPSSNATFASQIVLNGGTLGTTGITATRTWTSSSTLNVTANSTIALGSNAHTLTFAASNGVEWTAGTTLTITGWTGVAGSSGSAGKINVGVNGLTPGQLAQISFTGYSAGATILSTGEIVPADLFFSSRQSGNWGDFNTWSVSTNQGGSYINATSGQTPSSASGSIVINNLHTVTVAASVTVDQVTINQGGTISVSASQTLTIANGADAVDFTVNGTLSNSGTITGTGTMQVSNTGIYNHLVIGGAIPTATWGASSTLQIDASLAAGTLSQSFGNVNYNVNSTYSISNTLFEIQSGSTFTISQGTVQFTTTTTTDTWAGNLTVSGGTFIVHGGGGSCNCTATLTVNNLTISSGILIVNNNAYDGVDATLTVNGTLNLSGGTLNLDNTPATSSVQDTNLNLFGDFNWTGGTLRRTNAVVSGPYTNINFSGAGPTRQTVSQTLGSTTFTTNGRGLTFTETGASNLNLTLSGTTGTTPSTLTSLSGDLTINCSGTATLGGSTTVAGVVYMTEGTLLGTLTNNGSLVYNGTAAQTTGNVEWPSTFARNVTITNNSAAGVTLNADKTAYTGTFTVNNGSRFNFSTFSVAGTGAITVQSGATVASAFTTNAEGFGTSGDNAKGSIRVSGSRTLSTGANYILNGAAAQSTGTNMPATVNNLTIDNTTSGGGVTLSRATTVAGTLTLTNGTLTTTTGNLLTVTNTSTSAISGGSTTSFISGPVKWSIGTGTYIYPVGKSSTYLPFTLAPSASSSPVVTVEAYNTTAHPSATVVAPLTSISQNEYWYATLDGGSFTGNVSLRRQSALVSETVIAQSAAQQGAYTQIGGTASTPAINNSDNISSLGYFVMGNVVSCAAPSTQASNVTFSSVTSTGMTINWSRGGTPGDGVIVVVKASSAPTAPTSGVSYSASTTFGLGADVGSSSFVVFNESGTSVSITGLSAQTTYHVAVYERNCTGVTTQINTTSPATGNQITLSAELSAHAASFTATTASSSSIDLSFSAASTISDGFGYIILQKTGSNPTGTPTDATSYTIGNTIGDGTIAAIITDNSVTAATITDLSGGTAYHFSLIPYSYNGSSSSTYNYYTAATIPTANATTTAGTNYFTRGDGNFSSTTNWSTTSGGASCDCVPTTADNIYISSTHDLTIDGNRTVNSVNIVGNTTTIAIGSGITLTVTGAINMTTAANATRQLTISGAGSVSAGSVTVGSSTVPNGDYFTTLISEINSFTVGSSGISITSRISGSFNIDATFSLRQGTLTTAGTITLTTVNAGGCTSSFAMNGGAQSGTLVTTASTPFSTSGPGTETITLNGNNGATVNYAGTAQTAFNTSYTNLTLSGSGNKTLAAFSVSGTLSVEGSAVGITTAPTFGTNSTLQYKNVGTRTTNAIEWPASSGPANLIIDNSGSTVTMLSPANRTLSGNLTLTAGTLADNGNVLTVGGNIAGTAIHTSSGLGEILMNGSAKTISGATLGNLELSNAGGFSLSGSPTINGSLTFTNGKLSIGSNTLNLAGTVASMNSTNNITGSANSNLNITGTGALGTLFFDGTTAGTTNRIADFTLNRTSTETATLGSGLVVSGNLILTNGTLTTGANTLTYSGSSISRTNGNIDASNASGAITFTNASGLTLPASLFSGNVNNITVNGGGITLGSNTTAAGTLALTSGTLTVGANTLTISGSSPTRSTGNIDASNNSATVEFTNTSGITLPASIFTGNVRNFTLNGSGGVAISSDMTVTGNVTLTSGTLSPSGSRIITMGGTTQTFSITGGAVSGVDNSNGNDISLTINSGSTTTFTGNATSNADNEKKFLNITVNGTLALSRGILSKFGIFAVNGTLRIDANGYLQATPTSGTAVSPTYGASSLLQYNTGGTYGRGIEWNSTSGAGRPNDVQISNATTLNYPNAGSDPFSTPLAIARDLTIDANSNLYMDFGAGTASGSLTIGRDINIAGDLSLGDTNGGNLNVGGNWTHTTGTFAPNSRVVTFNGATGDQTITDPTGETFALLTINKATSGGVILANPVTVNNTLALTKGNIILGDNNLTLTSSSALSSQGNSTSYIVTNGTGLVKQTISGAATYNFPVGSSSAYNPATITWAAPPGVTQLDVRYIASTASITGLPLTLGNCLIVNDVLNNGYWSFTNTGTSSSNFNISFTRNGHDNVGTNLNDHGIVRRTNSGSSWATAGTWSDPGSTPIIPASTGQVALSQNGNSSFGEFAIAKGSRNLHTITLTSSNNTQTVCPSTAIANITYTIGGGATGAGVTGLPTGVSGNFSGGVFTISGTPTISGTYNYTVTTSGNSCGTVQATGTITVSATLSFANLQFPSSGSICSGGSLNIFGQAFASGVTEASGQGSGLEAEFGYSSSNNNPSGDGWTWATATFNTNSNNNDEFTGTLSGLAVGTYYYTFRYRLNGCAWQYGGFNAGFWNGTNNVNGMLTISNPPTTASAGSNQTICEGKTVILAANAPTSGSGVWTISGPNSNTNQLSSTTSNTATFTPTAFGTYTLTWTITSGGCAPSTSNVTITVNRGILDFVNMETENATVCFGTNANISGRVFEAGVSEAVGQGANIEAQIGYNTANTNPNTWDVGNWTSANYLNQGGIGNNDDRYQGTLGASLAAGTYYYALRYRINGCDWKYGGYSVSGGGEWGVSNINGTLTVRPQFTSGEISSTGQTICYGGTPTEIGSTTAAIGGDNTITYSWRSSADSYASAISGATSVTYTPPAGLTTTTSYRRYANDGTCNTSVIQSTGEWTVTVRDQFTSGAIATTGQTICYGGTPTEIGSTTAASGGDNTSTYSWRSSADSYASAISGATSATYIPPTGLTTTTSYRRYANDGTCNTTATESTGTWTVTVRDQFTSGAIATTGQTICYGGTPTEIGSTTAASGGDNTITYSWRSSADSYASAISGATSATYTPPAGLTTTTSYRRYANDGTCNTTATVSTGTWTVTVTNTNTWTGTVSKEWSDPANWSCGSVPDANSDIVISTSLYAPELDLNYTLPSGKTLTITGTGTLTIGSQSILTIAGTADFGGKSVVMKSDSNGTAILGQVTGTLLNANNVTVERYIPKGKRAFRFLTTGVTTTNFIRANWQNNGVYTPGKGTHITGSSSALGFDATTLGNPSMFYYNNQVASGSGWTQIPNTHQTNLLAGMGYRILIRGDRTSSLITTASQPLMNVATTLSATGTLTIGTVTYNSGTTPAINTTDNSTTNGYSLIGNPYVSPIDWHAVTLNNIENVYYTWDPNMGNDSQRGRYVAYTITGVNTGVTSVPTSQVNRFIQPGQAFFVKTSNRTNPSITFDESNKASTFRNVFREETPVYTKLNISLFEPAELGIGGYALDGVVALYGDSFSNTVGIGDVPKMEAGGENLAIFGNNLKLAMQGSSPIQNNDELLLKTLRLVANKNYTFKINAVNFDASVTAYLVDNFSATTTQINLTQDYFGNFSTTSVVASYSEDRFKIVFKVGTLATPDFESSISLYPNPSTTNAFYLNIPNWTDDIKVKLHNAVGQEMPLEVSTSDGIVRYCKSKIDLAAGMYIITITKEGSTVNKKWLIQR